MSFDIEMYRELFLEEAKELFESADNILLVAEQNESLSEEDMSQLFRDVHTLKGSGASVELKYFSEFTHDVENLMDKLRNHQIDFKFEMIDVLIDSSDCMKELLELENNNEITDEIFKEKTEELLIKIKSFINNETDIEVINSETKDETENNMPNPTLLEEEFNNKDFGFFNKKLISHLENEDFGFFADFKEETKTEVKKEDTKKTNINKETSLTKNTKSNNNIRVNLDKIDNLMNNVGDLVITNAMLTQYGTTISDNKTRISVLERLELLERHIREMQDSIMSIRMVPMDSIYSKFPKVVRDISKKLDKKVNFEHEGDTVEIDKAMIEGLTDPLMHIIRNSLDHGIETPAERLENNKKETGTIKISAEQANGQMIITIKDDGKGIDSERVAEKALENGLINDEQFKTMNKKDKAELIFGAGLSTAKEVTDISGRGVGMDVVKTNINKLGGVINLDTTLGEGTTITIMLPLTLAILDGLDIAIGENIYILPLNSIVESLQPDESMIKKVGSGRQELLMLREEFIPIVRINDLFEIKQKHEKIEEGMLIVVQSGQNKIALFIDEFLHQHQVVVKPLDKNYRSVEGIGAATVRGDGSIGLILDVLGIIEAEKNYSTNFNVEQ